MPPLICVSPYDIAQRFIGVSEVAGSISNPQILAMLRLDSSWPTNDEVPWCSAFVNYVMWLLRLPRSKSLSARSWLGVGVPINTTEAVPGFDVVILSRGNPPQPGPDVIDAPGHVGLFSGFNTGAVYLLGGNQGNKVCVAPFPQGRILGIRRMEAQ